jgi:hypothetical protein
LTYSVQSIRLLASYVKLPQQKAVSPNDQRDQQGKREQQPRTDENTMEV